MKTYARYARGIIFHSSVACICVFGFYTASVNARQAAPIIEGTASTPQNPNAPEVRLSFEERLSRIERRLDNDAMSEVMRRLDFLQQDMQRLIGDMELVNHEIDGIKKRQRELYLDVDRRLNQLTQKIDSMSASPAISVQTPAAGSSAPASSAANSARAVPPGVGPSTATDTNISRDAYERAFNLLKEGRYELAIAAFKAFIETYPTASYADNAQYWLGEANYAKQNYKIALQEFNKVLDNYPQSAKIPDAMLKIGYCYAELGNSQQATVVLNNIISHYPDSTAARLATKRLTILKN